MTTLPELLITGASGFVGGALQTYLFGFPDFHVHTLSVRGTDWQSHDFSQYDAIVHAAGIAHILSDASMDAQYHAINFELTRTLAEKARAQGVKQFVFLSSMIVFGEAAPAGVRCTITPDTVPVPVHAYGQSKLDAENALRALETPDFRVAILRPPMIYGPGCKGNYNTLVRLARKLPVFPEFQNRRSMLYIGNLTEMLRLVLEDGVSGTFHPCDGEPKSVTEIVAAICLAHGKHMHFLRMLSPFVRLLGGKGLVRRAFGDMVYDSSMPDFPKNYQRYTFEQAIAETEGCERW